MIKIRLCNDIKYDNILGLKSQAIKRTAFFMPLSSAAERRLNMNKNFIKYIASLLLFGMNGVISAAVSFPSRQIVFWRTLIGSIVLTAALLFSGKKITLPKHPKHLLYICLSGISMGLSWIFLFEAYNRVGVSIASLEYYCGPVTVMLISPVVFSERLTNRIIAGFLAVLCGVFLISFQKPGSALSASGLLLGALSALMYAGMVIFNKKAESITGLENSAVQMSAGFLTAAACMLLQKSAFAPILPSDILPVLTLGFINTGLGCLLYFSSIGGLSAQTVASFGCVELLSAVIFSFIFLHESMTLPQLGGAVLMICGTCFSNSAGKKHMLNQNLESD